MDLRLFCYMFFLLRSGGPFIRSLLKVLFVQFHLYGKLWTRKFNIHNIILLGNFRHTTVKSNFLT